MKLTERKIHIITTGGTIEKTYSEQSGVVQNQFNRIREYLEKLRLPAAELEILPFCNKDSREMTMDDRYLLSKNVAELLGNQSPIIVTHGTDTLVETGLYLQQRLSAPKVPVILTGAMTPLGFEGSDGLQNLTESLLAAQLLTPGIFVVLHGQVFPINSVRKDKERCTFISTTISTT